MGFAQIYISVVFTIIVFSVMALRQVIENREYKENYIVLHRLGASRKAINHTLLQQIIISFLLPVLAVILITIGGLFSLGQTFDAVFHGENLIWQGVLLYYGLFTILYTGYIVVTYKSIRKNNEGSLNIHESNSHQRKPA